MPVCDIPFYPNNVNYAGKKEHDANLRKFWFLILDCGLFTRKSDAKKLIGEGDEILTYDTRAEAVERWTQHCCQYHDQSDLAHQAQPPTLARSSPAHTPTPASGRVDAPRQRRSQDASVEPAAQTPAPGSASARARSRAKTPASGKRTSPPLPLFRDDDEPSPPRRLKPATAAPSPALPSPSAESPPVNIGDSDSSAGSPEDFPVGWGPAPASRVVSPRATASLSPRARFPLVGAKTDCGGNVHASPRLRSGSPVNKRAKVGPKAPAASAHARTAAAAPFRHTPVPPSPAAPCLPSAGSPADPPPVYAVESGSEPSSPSSPTRAGRAPTAGGPEPSPSVTSVSSLSSAGASEGLGSTRPLSRGGLGPPRVGTSSTSSASRNDVASSASRSGFAPSAPRGDFVSPTPVVLYNSGSRKFYVDPALAVREMSENESVEVVDYEDVTEFLSARAGRKAGERA